MLIMLLTKQDERCGSERERGCDNNDRYVQCKRRECEGEVSSWTTNIGGMATACGDMCSARWKGRGRVILRKKAKQ